MKYEQRNDRLLCHCASRLSRPHGACMENEMMKPPITICRTTFHGLVELRTNLAGIALLRQLQHHAPDMRIECSKAQGTITGFRVALSQFSFEHADVKSLNMVDNPPQNDKGDEQ